MKTKLVPGKPCPTCGKPVGLSNAARAKLYRERVKKAALKGKKP